MACCINLSVTVGTPRFLTPPSGFGISTLPVSYTHLTENLVDYLPKVLVILVIAERSVIGFEYRF